jgi:hypothetical protein
MMIFAAKISNIVSKLKRHIDPSLPCRPQKADKPTHANHLTAHTLYLSQSSAVITHFFTNCYPVTDPGGIADGLVDRARPVDPGAVEFRRRACSVEFCGAAAVFFFLRRSCIRRFGASSANT